MKYEVTEKGVYDAKGERVPVGTEIEVKGDDVPAYLKNKARPLGKAKAAVTNPAKGPVQQTEGYAVVDKGRGWFVVTKDGEEVTKSLREDDVKGFDAMSDADKAAFVDLRKPE